jgi:predicted DNA-binding mobile mystery protein A
METHTQKETIGEDSLGGLAELLKFLSPAGTNLGRLARVGNAGDRARVKGARVRPALKAGRKSGPDSEETRQLRAELDDIGLAFRLCGSKVQRPEGWMRAVRQAIGIPVVELARRMGVKKSQIFRLEESEQQGRVRVDTLRRAAEAMGCELVYALVPREGKLASMAAQLRGEEEARREEKVALRKARTREASKSAEVRPRYETIRQEAERLGIAKDIYGL